MTGDLPRLAMAARAGDLAAVRELHFPQRTNRENFADTAAWFALAAQAAPELAKRLDGHTPPRQPARPRQSGIDFHRPNALALDNPHELLAVILPACLSRRARKAALAVMTGHLTPFPGGLAKASTRRGRPVAIVIADGPPSLGPTSWLCVRRLAEWRRTIVMVIGDAVEREQYVKAARAAEHYGRALIVEADAATATLWLERFDFHQNRRVLN